MKRYFKKLQLEFLRFIRVLKDDPWEVDITEIYLVYRPFLLAYRFFYFIIVDFAQKKTIMVAASLSYATVLGIIPIMLVILALSKGLLAENFSIYTPQIVDFLVYKIAPVFKNLTATNDQALHASIQTYINTHLIPVLTNINLSKIGIFGAIVLIIIALSLIKTVDKAFNDIWGIYIKRPIIKIFLNYWLFIAIFPIIILLIIWLTGFNAFKEILYAQHRFWLVEMFSDQLGTFIIMWVVCSLMYFVIPNTRVKLIPSVIGGIIAGSLWQLNNMLSFLFVSNAIRSHYIYGSIGIIPILMIALFVGWLIILLGAHVAFGLQNLSIFRINKLIMNMQPCDKQEISVMSLAVIGKQFLDKSKPHNIDEIADISGLPSIYLTQVLDALRSSGFIIETTDEPPRYVLTTSPDSIRLKSVMDNSIGLHKRENNMPLVSNKKLWKDVLRVCQTYRNFYNDESNPTLSHVIEKLLRKS